MAPPRVQEEEEEEEEEEAAAAAAEEAQGLRVKAAVRANAAAAHTSIRAPVCRSVNGVTLFQQHNVATDMSMMTTLHRVEMVANARLKVTTMGLQHVLYAIR